MFIIIYYDLLWFARYCFPTAVDYCDSATTTWYASPCCLSFTSGQGHTWLRLQWDWKMFWSSKKRMPVWSSTSGNRVRCHHVRKSCRGYTHKYVWIHGLNCFPFSSRWTLNALPLQTLVVLVVTISKDFRTLNKISGLGSEVCRWFSRHGYVWYVQICLPYKPWKCVVHVSFPRLNPTNFYLTYTSC